MEECSVPHSEEYIREFKDFISETYDIHVVSLISVNRGQYSESWKVDADSSTYFVKLNCHPYHQVRFQNSLAVIDYLNQRIDFISKIVKNRNRQLYSTFRSGILAIFEWIDGKNEEAEQNRALEYPLLCKIYPLTKPGFAIPTETFSADAGLHFFDIWEKLKQNHTSERNSSLLSVFEAYSREITYCASRLFHFSAVCRKNCSNFYFTHGNAGRNLLAAHGRNTIVSWDEVMYAPPERDAWVMCGYDWARKLFDESLQKNGISYRLRTERLNYYCYHTFFLYLNMLTARLPSENIYEQIRDFLKKGWFQRRILLTDPV